MTKDKKEVPIESQLLTEADRPDNPARLRVRELMLKMAPLAFVAATPLTVCACDPAPTPLCEHSSRYSLVGIEINVNASWESDGGTPVIKLVIAINTAIYSAHDSTDRLQLPADYRVFGGTLISSSPIDGGDGYTLWIQPDRDLSLVQVDGIVECHGKTTSSGPFTVILRPATADGGAAGTEIVARITGWDK
jgi:hypothetical protein